MKFVAFLTVVALAATVSSLYPRGTANAEPTDESTSTVNTSSTPTTSTIATPTAPPAARYERLPRIKRGTSKAKADKLLRDCGFVPVYRKVLGKKQNKVKKVATSKWTKRHCRKKSKTGHWVYKEGTRVIVYLYNGWRRGVATRYSIADNTPRNSKATSSGIPLGSLHGMTCASTGLPEGSKVRIRRGKRAETITVTDYGGYETVDLFTTAANKLHVDKNHITYFVIRVGWHGKEHKP